LSVSKRGGIETFAVRTLKEKMREVRGAIIKNNGRLKEFITGKMSTLKDVKGGRLRMGMSLGRIGH